MPLSLSSATVWVRKKKKKKTSNKCLHFIMFRHRHSPFAILIFFLHIYHVPRFSYAVSCRLFLPFTFDFPKMLNRRYAKCRNGDCNMSIRTRISSIHWSEKTVSTVFFSIFSDFFFLSLSLLMSPLSSQSPTWFESNLLNDWNFILWNLIQALISCWQIEWKQFVTKLGALVTWWYSQWKFLFFSSHPIHSIFVSWFLCPSVCVCFFFIFFSLEIANENFI